MSPSSKSAILFVPPRLKVLSPNLSLLKRMNFPKGCDLVAAAAIPLAYGTSHQALVHRSNLKSKQMRAKSLLINLSRDKDEVDGSSIFMYGEGWDFGEVVNNGRGINGLSYANHVLKIFLSVGMAANLKEFVLTNCDGQETAMEISVDERCRINHLATSVITLSQGVPFFHCVDEILRSKTLDSDSYNSGDWFNRLDYSYSSNNWGVGLPPKGKNEKNWPIIKPRLASPSFKPQKSDIISALENFQNLLCIRYSSVLLRLRTANAIQERVRFHNTGVSQIPGVIVTSIEDGHEGVPGLSQLNPVPVLRGKAFRLHLVQMMSTENSVKNSTYDPSLGCFRVPSRTAAVFVEPR
ncbi:hypothetical protein L6452_41942 [Arctium lappa]|uniref:Uncharacterized protein n=1 Tax=Arctium lappa TaxID=4217 RepID=A0ACB8XI32_ARCLA|nr:hypothetical protein L6452_41942 [Arctium lappa]